MRILLIFVAVFGVSAQGDWSDIGSPEFSMRNYPIDESDQWDKDFNILLEWQGKRTAAQCALARKQPHPTFKIFYGHTELISPDEFEATKELGERVAKFSERVATYFKSKYERPRPYTTNPAVQPCIPKVPGAKSYPSSHAVVAVATACMLTEIFPEKKEDLAAYADEIANLRYIVGVHHPSDVGAGKQLGRDICDRLIQNPDFQRDLKAIQKP